MFYIEESFKIHELIFNLKVLKKIIALKNKREEIKIREEINWIETLKHREELQYTFN